MFCYKCGNEYDNNSKFCPHCGAPANQGAAPNPGNYAPGGFNQGNNNQSGYNPGFNQANFTNHFNSAMQPPQPNSPIRPRSIATCIILSIVTCGLYIYYWLYCMAEDLNKVTREPNPTSGGMVLLLSIITCGIYLWIWMYKAGERLSLARQAKTGYPGSNNGVLYLVLCLFGLGIVSYALIQNELNELAA